MKKLVLVLGVALSAQMASAAPQTFKMYDRPHAEVNPGCDIYTELVLDVNNTGGTAVLRNRVSGSCEIAVQPKRRSYNLMLSYKDACGTRHYVQDDDSDVAVAVDDNRGRTCENPIEALVIVNEYNNPGGKEATLYSR